MSNTAERAMTDDPFEDEQSDDDEEAMDTLGPFVLRAINAHPAGAPMKPSQIATETLRLIDPDGISPEIVREGCHRTITRLAQQMLDRAVERGRAEIIRTH